MVATLDAPERYVRAAGRFGPTALYDVDRADYARGALAPDLARPAASGGPERRSRPRRRRRTGTLAIALAAARPDVEVMAVDGDTEALALAAAKPGAERVRWQPGLAGDLDLPDASVDAAVMSLVLHHLAPATKRRALADLHRVLQPGGQLHVADWGRPATPLLRATFFVLQLLDGFEGTRDHAAGRLPEFLGDAGFENVRRSGRLRTAWGTLELLHSERGDTSPPPSPSLDAARRRSEPRLRPRHGD